MEETISQEDIIQLARCMVDAMADKKGEDIVLMDLRQHALFADYFVICSGTSERQLKAIAEAVNQAARQQFHVYARNTEGDAPSGWILIDFNDVIVHIFDPQQREFYNLEELWKEAPIVLQVQ